MSTFNCIVFSEDGDYRSLLAKHRDKFFDYELLKEHNYCYPLKFKAKPDDKGYRKSQYDFFHVSPDDIYAKKELEEHWDAYVEGRDDSASDIFSREYYKNLYGTKENYVEQMMLEVPEAFITPDGEWFEYADCAPFRLPYAVNKYTNELCKYIHSNEDLYVSILEMWD